MNKIKWSELSPRERDALIAEKVMGWKEVHLSNNTQNRFSLESMTVGIYPTDQSTNLAEVPYYSTDIATAWQVRNKITELDEKVVEEFIGYFIYHQIDITEITPENICQAALAAVGVEIEP